MTQTKILIIATSADRMTNGEATGIWLEELTTPYYAFSDAGAEVTLASIKGGAIPLDQRSLAPKGENDASVERYLDDPAFQQAV
ncbi:MAG: type 1 glutamine amidotransferase domain-containing protein, partial [Pseudomonadota bacterium]